MGEAGKRVLSLTQQHVQRGVQVGVQLFFSLSERLGMEEMTAGVLIPAVPKSSESPLSCFSFHCAPDVFSR